MNRRALIALCLVVAVDAASFGLLLPVLPFLVGKLTGTFNAIAITQVTAIYAGFQLLGAPIIGHCSDRYGRKPVLAVAVAVSTIALLGSALANDLTSLMIWQAINGAFAGVFAVAQAIVADSVEPGDQRTVSFGALGASLGLGFVAGPALGGLLGSMDPRAPFFAAALFSLANLGLLLSQLQESRRSKAEDERSLAPLKLFSPQQRELQRLLTVYALFYLGFSAFTGIFVLDAKTRFNWGPQAAGLVLCYVGVVAAVIQGAFLPKLLKRFKAERLSVAGLLLVAVAMFGVAGIQQGRELYATQLLFAAGVGISTPGLRSLMSQHVQEHQQGALGGLTQAAVSLTQLLGPLMAGQLYAKTGSASTFEVQAALVLTAAALLISAPGLRSTKHTAALRP
ncbi:MAG: hypothetical protein DCO99_05610 [Synechococcus sp. XM-24]|nr:MAG: hypothetical protein DCO99_05610 [Synechococcus sp. XM-24]